AQQGGGKPRPYNSEPKAEMLNSLDVLFTDIKKMLSGYVFFEPVNEEIKKFRAISKYKGKFYLLFFTLQTRDDCPGLIFAVILSVYITRHKKDIELYETWLTEIKKQYGDTN
ncbi:MAG: hypothetical protein MUD08_06800, partial [Cytophagales bacterium]|nr:hypothetical protein [Cytophagales bacterium]